MKIAPLIHSRTLKCDYNMKFAVRPKDFNDSLIYWARSVILPATGDLDFVNNVRQIVASKGEIKFAGIVCTMKYFVENLLDGDEQNRARNYSRDNANRNFGVFLGYSFKAGNEIPDVTYSDLWKMFERYLVPKWDWEIFDTPQIDYEYEVRGKKSSATIAERVKKINGVEIYESSLNADENLFENYLARSMKEDVVFCSALEQFQPIAGGIYTAVTTSASIITRLENSRRKTDLPKKKTNCEFENICAAPSRVSKIDTDVQKFSFDRFVNLLNNTCRHLVLYDKPGKQFRAKFTFERETISRKIKINCELEEI